MPSPVVELNAAVAVSMADGPEAALRIADSITGLDDYYLWYAARADFLRRLDRDDEAAAAYTHALELAPSDVEREFLRSRLAAALAVASEPEQRRCDTVKAHLRSRIHMGGGLVKRDQMFRWGGVVSGAVLMVFGIVVIVLAISGHNTVTTELKQQKITGTPDMTPSAIKAEGEKAGLKNVAIQRAPSRPRTPAKGAASPST